MSTQSKDLAKRSVVDDAVISQRTEMSGELAPTAAMAEKQFEVQSAIAIAKRFPRNEDVAFGKLMRSCSRTAFAEEARYRFPRGKVKDEQSGRWVPNYVEGPSVNMAREGARVWENIRYGLEVVRDDDDTRQIRGWAWDVETNVKTTAEDEFKKLIQRKVDDNNGQWVTKWIKPDERDLRELTNRRGAILERNCILKLLPRDLVEDAMNKVRETLSGEAKQDPDAARKKLILGFGRLNVTPEMLEEYLGHKLAECSPQELTDLRAMWKSIDDGQVKWGDYVGAMDDGKTNKPGKQTATGTLDIDKLKAGEGTDPHATDPAPATASTEKRQREPGEEEEAVELTAPEAKSARERIEILVNHPKFASTVLAFDVIQSVAGVRVVSKIPRDKLLAVESALTDTVNAE